MGTPVKSKLKLNKQLSEELIIACNFRWWFFHFKRTLSSLQEHVKNCTYNLNTNVILSGQPLQFCKRWGLLNIWENLPTPEDWPDTMETGWSFTEITPALG